VPGFTDKGQTEELGRKIEKLSAFRMNSESPDKELSRWLDKLCATIRKRLGEIGLIDGRTAAASRLLNDHVADFHTALLVKGVTPAHGKLTKRRILAVFEGCGFRLWSDLHAVKIEQYLADRRAKGDWRIRRLSNQSSNYYLQAVQQFARWMVKNKRATSSVVDDLSPLNAAVDRQRHRRALSIDELRHLLAVTLTGPESFGVSGTERAMLYRLAVESGLRSNELRSLTRSSFRFGSKLTTVIVEAVNSKRRRRDELPIRVTTAVELKKYLANNWAGVNAFVLPRADQMADMIRRDLKAARQTWLNGATTPQDRTERERSTFLAERNEDGHVFDFHSLRHTFLTNLVRSGVHPKLAQQLARHSTIVLTMDRYSHVTLGEQHLNFCRISRKFRRTKVVRPRRMETLNRLSSTQLSWRIAWRKRALRPAPKCTSVQ
jgi:integrase